MADQYSIIKNPIPLVVGNVSLRANNKDEYNYMTVYLCDATGLANPRIIFYDTFSNQWMMTKEDYSSDLLFPYISENINRQFGYIMQGFINNQGGYPIFYRRGQYTTGVQTIHFDKYANKWGFGWDSKSFSLDNDNYGYYLPTIKDFADNKYGNSYDGTEIGYVSEFQPDEEATIKYGGTNGELMTLENGNITVPSSILEFENNVGGYLSSRIFPPSNIIKVSESPTIISGEPCLGYYDLNGRLSYNPYIIGNICIGTRDQTVPPIVGSTTTKVGPLDVYSASVYEGEFWGYQCYENAYTYIGCSIDQTQEKWRLFRLNVNVPDQIGKNNGNIILLKGNNNKNPIIAEKYWYLSNAGDLFNYTYIRNGVTFRPVGESGNLRIEIVAITGLKPYEVRHPGEHYIQPNTYDTYIGTWLTPQPKWSEE